MGDKGVAPSLETYNILIDCFGRKHMFRRCLEILEIMEDNGLKPTIVTYGGLINYLCKYRNLLEAEVIFRDMIGRGVAPDAPIYNMLIKGQCTAGKLLSAFSLFDEMVRNNVVPTLVTYNSLIDGLCKKGQLEEAERQLTQISDRGLTPDAITYNILIHGFYDAGEISKCLELYERMKTSAIKPTLHTFYSLVMGCNKEGQSAVDQICKEMSGFGPTPDRVVYSALIYSYSEHGNIEKALSLFNEMTNSLIRGHFKVGCQAKIKDLVADMKARGVLLQADTYTVLINGYCKLNDYKAAYAWYREMADEEFLLVAHLCNELISGLKSEGMLKEADLVYSKMRVKALDEVAMDGDLSAVTS